MSQQSWHIQHLFKSFWRKWFQCLSSQIYIWSHALAFSLVLSSKIQEALQSLIATCLHFVLYWGYWAYAMPRYSPTTSQFFFRVPETYIINMESVRNYVVMSNDFWNIPNFLTVSLNQQALHIFWHVLKLNIFFFTFPHEIQTISNRIFWNEAKIGHFIFFHGLEGAVLEDQIQLIFL